MIQSLWGIEQECVNALGFNISPGLLIVTRIEFILRKFKSYAK